MGEVDEGGQRFIDSKRIEGNLMDMLETTVAFLKVSQKIDSFMSSLGVNVMSTE